MARSRHPFTLSAQQVDPLSWFTGPFVPLTLAALVLVNGGISIAATWTVARYPALQLLALALCVLAPLMVHRMTRPLRRTLGWASAIGAIGVAVAGVAVSALGYGAVTFPLELWWAPIAMGLAIVSLGPYLPGRILLIVGGSAIVVVVAFSYRAVESASHWGSVSTAVIIATAPALCLAAMVTFSYAVVSASIPLLERSSRIRVAGRAGADEAAAEAERATLARLTARAAPFLAGLAESARVSPADRALAGQLARRLRDELVTQSSVSWLDSIASESRLVVVDPDRLARRMTSPQRTALLGLLRAILDTPGTDSESLMVDLRKARDGATAVAVSLDMTLPEGRRIMHLAPYYLTLKTTAQDLSIEHNGISFRFDPS